MTNEIAKILLEIKAVHLNPDDFFTWTSGIKSPIYCDNRQIISYPEYRNQIVQNFVSYIQDKHSEADLIAGTSTAGIPWAAWIADKLNLPMIYIRSGSKGHGLKNAIEGKITQGQKTLVIEDLISTGKSSIQAANEVKEAGLNLLEIVSIFNYDFSKAKEAFNLAKMEYHSLCTLPEMLHFALQESLLTQSQIDIINEWKTTIENN